LILGVYLSLQQPPTDLESQKSFASFLQKRRAFLPHGRAALHRLQHRQQPRRLRNDVVEMADKQPLSLGHPLGRRGERNQARTRWRPNQVACQFGDGHAIQVGKIEVQQNDVEDEPPDQQQRPKAVRRGQNFMARVLQRGGNQLAENIIIVHHQYAGRLALSRRTRLPHRRITARRSRADIPLCDGMQQGAGIPGLAQHDVEHIRLARGGCQDIVHPGT
jgi:hypothetical protein